MSELSADSEREMKSQGGCYRGSQAVAGQNTSKRKGKSPDDVSRQRLRGPMQSEHIMGVKSAV